MSKSSLSSRLANYRARMLGAARNAFVKIAVSVAAAQDELKRSSNELESHEECFTSELVREWGKAGELSCDAR